MFNSQRFIIIVSVVILSSVTIMAQGWDEVKINTIPVTDNLYMLEGRGGNIGLLITDDQVMLIDGQFAELHDKIMDAITTVTDKPLKILVNTHWHGDHTGGNALFNARGAIIVAHEAVKTRLTNGGTVPFFGSEVLPQPVEALPKKVFTSDSEMKLNGETMQIVMAPAAHTDGDAFIYMAENNALHMGDVYFAEMYPFIDLPSGGTIQGMITACASALELADSNTMVIPGHGPLTDIDAFRDYTDMLIDITGKVETLKTEEIDLKVVVDQADAITGPYEERFGSGFISAKDLLTFVFESL